MEISPNCLNYFFIKIHFEKYGRNLHKNTETYGACTVHTHNTQNKYEFKTQCLGGLIKQKNYELNKLHFFSRRR